MSRAATLFHFTTAAGLLGVLTSSRMWATDLRFLNDAEESVYARERFVHAVRDVENPALAPTHSLHDLADEFGQTFARYKRLVEQELSSFPFGVYVACFCESGDLLSQWRAYGSDHGYAIEVKVDALEDAFRGRQEMSLELRQVRYGQDAADDLVAAAMHAVSEDTNLGHLGVHAHFMAARLASMVATVKHPGFKEEREWRIVSTFESENPQLVRFRSTPMAIVPYIEVPLPKDAFISVRVGPGRHVDVREEGVRRLLAAVGCEAAVCHSNLPLRT
jgi:Protein of unknown function (DUF2971)